MAWNNNDWADKQREFQRSADQKRRIINEARQLAHSDDFRSAGQRMKELAQEFKNAGFAGRDENQSLWDEFSGARDIFYRRQSDYWEQRNREAEGNAEKKRRIVGELRGLVNPTDWREAGARVKELHAEWKDIGFAGKDENQRLNDEYYGLRNSFYANSKDHWERRNQEYERNKYAMELLVREIQGYADHPDPKSQKDNMRRVLAAWKDLPGPVKKEDREELSRRFWAAKDRYYSRRDAQYAQGQANWERGKGPRSSVQSDPAWSPKNKFEAEAHLVQAIRDAEAAVREADAYYDSVRAAGGRSWLLPSKQNAKLANAQQRQKIARERLDNLKRRLFELRQRR